LRISFSSMIYVWKMCGCKVARAGKKDRNSTRSGLAHEGEVYRKLGGEMAAEGGVIRFWTRSPF
jgi:hypothetical protein